MISRWIFSSKSFLKCKWNPQYRKQSEEELASRIRIAQTAAAVSCFTVSAHLLLTSGFKRNPVRRQLTSRRVLEKASMKELHRVFSVTWELEQDFYSKPCFFHFSSFTFSLWRVQEQFVWSLHLYPVWIFYTRGIDLCYSWGWKWLLVALKSNLAQCRAISKEKLLRTMPSCLELLQRTHLQGWSFPPPRAAPIAWCTFFPLVSNQCFPCCDSQPLPPGLSLGTSESLTPS